jgi:hypothetical protein
MIGKKIEVVMDSKSLFDELSENDWEKEYIGMPEYDNKKAEPPKITAVFKFKTQKDFDMFNSLIKKHLYNGRKPFDGMQRKDSKSTWFPLNEKTNEWRYV